MGTPRLRTSVIAFAVACATAAIVACGSSISPTPPPPPPPPVNTPPQITSITVSDTRIEVDGPSVTVTAVVEDQETPPANLTYAWSAETGVFTGAGAIVSWSPSADAKTPADYVLTLTVTERYVSGSTTAEHTATSTLTVHVNNSPKELADLSVRFLGDFANSKISPEMCVAEFDETQPPCARGKADEFNDIFMNRHDLLILASTIRPTSVSIAASRTTATVHTFCSFTSRVITKEPLNCPGCIFGDVGTTSGDCFTTNVYQTGRWWLCESHYNSSSNSLSAFERALERALFGIRR